MKFLIKKSEEEWKKILNDKNAEELAFEVTQKSFTEKPFTGKYEQHWENGEYRCICCDSLLFKSDKKFDACCGWPSFYEVVKGAIKEIPDLSITGRPRTETVCSNCGAHLGHVFNDGPYPTGLRYCINSASIQFADN